MARWSWIPHEPRDMPPIMRRQAGRATWMFAIIIVGWLPLMVAIQFGLGFRGPPGVFSILLYLPIYVVIGVSATFSFRLKRRVRDADGLVCTNCLYDLRGIVDADACPECGQSGSADTMRERWRKAKILRS